MFTLFENVVKFNDAKKTARQSADETLISLHAEVPVFVINIRW